MADTYARLLIDFEAQTRKFVQPMQQATTSLQNFGKMAKSVAGIASAYFAVSKIISFSKSVLESTDALAKQSRRMGITIKEMDALELAFKWGGMEAAEASKSLDLFGMSLAKLSSGDVGIARAFDRIGIDRFAVAGRSLVDVLGMVSDRMGEVDRSTRALAGRELFGRGGIKVLEGLTNLRAAQEEIRAIYEGLGIVDDRSKNIEELNDAFTTLQKTISLTGRVIAMELAPEIKSLVKGAGEVALHFGNMFGLVGDVISDVAEAEGVDKLEALLMGMLSAPTGLLMPQETRAILKEIKEAREFHAGKQTGAGGDEGFGAVFGRMMDAAKKDFEQQQEIEKAYTESLEDMAEKIQSAAKPALDVYTEAVRDLDAMLERGMITQEEWTHAATKAYETYTKNTPELALAEAMTNKYTDAVALLKMELEQLQWLQGAGIIDEGTAARGIASITEQLQNLDPALMAARQSMEEFQNSIASFAESEFAATRSPFEIYEEHMWKLDEALQMGMISLDTYWRSAARAAEEVDRALGLDMPQQMEPWGMPQMPQMPQAQRPATAGMATASQIAGVLAGGSVEDISRKQLGEQQLMNHQLQQLVFNSMQWKMF